MSQETTYQIGQLSNRMLELLGEEWFKEELGEFVTSEYFLNQMKAISEDRKYYTVYPQKGSDLIFKAFRTTPPSKTKVVIFGQDPYHDGSFDGFAFSNANSTKISPSLKNILAEVDKEYPDELDNISHGKLVKEDLSRWAEQGVLLINVAHTVRAGEPESHLKYWMDFTKTVIHVLNKYRPIYLLWGKKAHALEKYIGDSLTIKTSHPSPFSANKNGDGFPAFVGSDCFKKVNEFLTEKIVW